MAVDRLRQRGMVRQALPATRSRGTGILAALACCLLLASVLILFFQVRGFLGHLETRLSAESGGDNRLRAINQHMEALQGKFNALLAESVELRLKTLEKNVESGKVVADDLRTFESLRIDLKALESYAQSSGAMGLDYARQEHGRYQALATQQPVLRNDELKGELAELKTLFYGCLAVFAVALLAMASYWSSQRRTIRRLETLAAPPPMLASPPSDSHG